MSTTHAAPVDSPAATHCSAALQHMHRTQPSAWLPGARARCSDTTSPVTVSSSCTQQAKLAAATCDGQCHPAEQQALYMLPTDASSLGSPLHAAASVLAGAALEAGGGGRPGAAGCAKARLELPVEGAPNVQLARAVT